MMSGGHRILLMLVGVSLLTSGQADCPPGDWVESRGSCYLFVLEPLSQVNAQTVCIEQEGNLTSVADEEENNFIYNLSLSRCDDAACRSVWFGLIKMGDLDTDPKDEGWTWLDGSTYDIGKYNKWKVSEPTGGMFCARMYLKDTQGVPGEWGDLDCGVTFPFVCKQRATAAPSTTTTTTTTTTSRPTTRTISTPIMTTTTTTPDWVSWRGSLYLFLVEETFSQEEAVSVCMSYGGRLASVLSPAEKEFIYITAQSSCTDSCNDVWIGLRRNGPFLGESNRDLDLAERRANWTWLDGQAYSSSWANWKSTEPTGDSACARMIFNQEQHLENWADISCDQQHPCICKKQDAEKSSASGTTESSGLIPGDLAPEKTSKSSMKNRNLGVGVGVALFVIAVVAIVVLAVMKLRKWPGKAEPAQVVASPSREAEGSVTYSNIPTSRVASVHNGGIRDEASGDGTIPNKHMTSPSDCDPYYDYDNVPATAKVYANVANDAAGVRDSYQHLTPHSLTSNTDNDSYQHLTNPQPPMPDTRRSNYQVLQEPDMDRSYEALASPTEGKLEVRSTMEPAYEDISQAHCDYDNISSVGQVCIK